MAKIIDYIMVTVAVVVGFSWLVGLRPYVPSEFAGFATMLLGRILYKTANL